MARIQFDPGLLICPDFASPTYAASRLPLVNENTTEEQAIQFLRDVWTAGNEAEKVRWQLQTDEEDVLIAERQRIQIETEDLRIQNEFEEAETLRKDELKRNKSKYLPIPDRDVPTVAPVFASNYAVRRMDKGLYVELWYYTNAGLEEASRNSVTVDDETMAMVRLPNGSTSWVPAASARTATAVMEDKNILWEDFCQAAPRMILAMEEANWPQERVVMLAKFWGNLQVHELRSSIDPLDQKTLLVYQAEQRRLWHLAISSPRGAYNISRINEEILKKTREKVYWDDRRSKDYERDYRVSLNLPPDFRDRLANPLHFTISSDTSKNFGSSSCSTHAPCCTMHAPLYCHVHAPCCSPHAPLLRHACSSIAPCMPLFAPCMLPFCSAHATLSLHACSSVFPALASRTRELQQPPLHH